jgi:hypothetical protein
MVKILNANWENLGFRLINCSGRIITMKDLFFC